MSEQGYNVDEDALDRKMCNMKKSYRTIKDNNKKSSTGRGRVHWEYYDIFEEIFRNDATINHRPTLSSMINSIPTTSTDESSMSSTSTTMNDEQTKPSESNDKVIFYHLYYISFQKQ